MKNNVYGLFFVLIVISLFAGCGPRKPSDVPKLYSTKITVQDAGKPISDALVVLIPKSNESSLIVSAKTDDNGVALIKTMRGNYIGKGAPADDYKVTVVKDVEVAHWKSPSEIANMTPPETEKYNHEMQKKRDALPRIIPIKLTGIDTTPLSLQVESQGKTSFEIDVNTYKEK